MCTCKPSPASRAKSPFLTVFRTANANSSNVPSNANISGVEPSWAHFLKTYQPEEECSDIRPGEAWLMDRATGGIRTKKKKDKRERIAQKKRGGKRKKRKKKKKNQTH